MQQQWRIRIRGTQRREVDVNLIVQAVLALGRQLRDEARKHAAPESLPATFEAPAPQSEDQS